MRPAKQTLAPRHAPYAGFCRGLALAFILAGAVVGNVPCSAQSDKGLLRSEFWADVEPVAAVGEEWPVTPKEARSRILSEAAWVFGGMIWGFEFSYTPYDRTRALEERFDIVPIETLSADAPSLAPGARTKVSNEIHSFVEYRPEAVLVSLMEDYASEPWKGAQGIGRADMDLGVKGRREAYKDGLRAALRSLLQDIEPNKPRLVRGRVVFDRPPTLAIIGGYYTAQVRVRAMVIEVIPYKIY
jgi:hypothetical protein